MKKTLKKEEVAFLVQQSYQELEKNQAIIIVEKKYLSKGGVISQLFSQLVGLESSSEKKEIGDLLNG
jgi:hypothetical protein